MLTETCLNPEAAVDLRRPVAPATDAVRSASTVLSRRADRSWRYVPVARSRKAFALALLISGGLHALLFFGFGHRTKAAPRRAPEEHIIALTLTMPDLKDLDEPEPLPGDDSGGPPDLGPPLPMQADVPALPQPSDFVQQIDLSSLLPRPDFGAAKIFTIPEHFGHGGNKIGEGLGSIFNLADLDRAPEPVLQMAPLYPPKLKKKGEEGIVRVEFVVDSQGRVVGAFVFESTNHGFDEVTLATIAKWKFRPGQRGGRAVNTRMRVPIAFSLSDGLDLKDL